MAKDKLKPPNKSKGDSAHTAARAVLGAIPAVGSVAAEIFNALIIPPIERRRDEWREQLAEALVGLIKKVDGLTAEALQQNDAFVTAVVHASQIALRNHQNEKREALRNAVLNIALGSAPDEDSQLMFLQFIDVLTPSHLRLLKLFQAPEEYANGRGRSISHLGMGGLGQVIEIVFPELQGRREFYDNLMGDLFSRGLTSAESTGVTMSGHGLTAKRTTKFGDEFLSFIESPVDGPQSSLPKGNIQRRGARIYRTPNRKFYDRTRIDESKGEMWFCTEAEARAAGWRRSKR